MSRFFGIQITNMNLLYVHLFVLFARLSIALQLPSGERQEMWHNLRSRFAALALPNRSFRISSSLYDSLSTGHTPQSSKTQDRQYEFLGLINTRGDSPLSFEAMICSREPSC